MRGVAWTFKRLARRLYFSTKYKEAIYSAQAAFICMREFCRLFKPINHEVSRIFDEVHTEEDK